jgi:hypothetical protein
MDALSVARTHCWAVLALVWTACSADVAERAEPPVRIFERAVSSSNQFAIASWFAGLDDANEPILEWIDVLYEGTTYRREPFARSLLGINDIGPARGVIGSGVAVSRSGQNLRHQFAAPDAATSDPTRPMRLVACEMPCRS